ncbi:MAG: amidase [Caldilineae bacterium]|nr:MAG: amidase [Caldilineae bacterium]
MHVVAGGRHSGFPQLMHDSNNASDKEITPQVIAEAEKLIDLTFTPEERELMVEGLAEQRDHYARLRDVPLANDVPPALLFDPTVVPAPAPRAWPPRVPDRPAALLRPESLDDLAFWPVSRLSHLLRSGQVTSLELTEMYLARLHRLDPLLHCIVTLTEERALEQARRADAELAAGRWRGPLHGIPYGVKDLLAARDYPTTWGAAPYRDQLIDMDATVVQRLDEAGAVLLAKLSVGALAWGDVWFGGKTRSPWNPERGSSGSSAGPGAATAAGLVGFAIGTETWGSIVSPSTRCGVSGLRPTFGRVSRHGAMALSWSMDKIGPMCRTVEDCALVFAAIHGADGRDPTATTRPFVWEPELDISTLRVGYVAADFEQEYSGRENDLRTLEVLRELGCELKPVSLPDYPIEALSFILTAEAAAAFDELTRSNRDDLLVRQEKDAWPNVFRQSRFVPAVEYIQANRVRLLLLHEMARLMSDLDVYVAPSLQGDNLLLTNLTGHPAVVVPNGFDEEGLPTSITFIGRLYDESTVLALARAYQEATDFHLIHPQLEQVQDG